MRETLLAPFLFPAKLRKTFGTAKSADAGGPGLSEAVSTIIRIIRTRHLCFVAEPD